MKLSEFTGKKGVEIAAKVMKPIFKLTANDEIRKLRQKKGVTVDEVLTGMVLNEPDAAMELYAILNEKDIEEYKNTCTAATILEDIFLTFADEDLMVLFGLRVRTTDTSSGSATENIKATEKK